MNNDSNGSGAGRQNISSGGPYEAIGGYSRGVRLGNYVAVSGSTTLGPDGVAHPGDCYRQAKAIFELIEGVLNEAGAQMSDVVRTRSFVTDIGTTGDFIRAHGEVFGDIRPASTLVEVSALIHPDLVIEIEVDAIIP
ncbi:RidA family protein [Candidatus Poriferisodalis sp.]|uniref:RidA family protein n=1 Tax=Candidatus Poriferisodalis sp. TaxID=3101277 RepID=UPI003C6F55FB